MVRTGLVANPTELREVVCVHLEEQLSRCDLPLLRHSFLIHPANNVSGTGSLDALAHALKPVPVFRESSQRLGKRLLTSVVDTFPELARCTHFLEAINLGCAHGHHSIVYGLVCSEMEIDLDTAMISFALTSVQGYVAAAIRLSFIGQSAAQKMMAGLHVDILAAADTARQMHLDDLGGSAPIMDISGLRHRTMNGRLFAS